MMEEFSTLRLILLCFGDADVKQDYCDDLGSRFKSNERSMARSFFAGQDHRRAYVHSRHRTSLKFPSLRKVADASHAAAPSLLLDEFVLKLVFKTG